MSGQVSFAANAVTKTTWSVTSHGTTVDIEDQNMAEIVHRFLTHHGFILAREQQAELDKLRPGWAV